MEPRIPAVLQGHDHIGYRGAFTPEQGTIPQHYGRNKSAVRLNDQLIPKPTDINIQEKMIRVATPREHPYSSHISRFAVFPSFRSPDDPDTGVRAASRTTLNPLVPARAPEVTLLSKTIGAPYRHEILKSPMTTSKKAVLWTGEHGFSDHAKPLMGESQIFYPSPPKTVLPNPKLRNWDLTLSERTAKMLKNLERTHWITSYQMDYTGSGPANPLKMDDFREKMSSLSATTSLTAPLRERSHPVFVPSKPREGRKGRNRLGSIAERSTTDELPNASPTVHRGAAAASAPQHRPQDISDKHNETTGLNLKGRSHAECNPEISQAEGHSSACERREKANCRVQFSESPTRASMSQSSQEAKLLSKADLEREKPCRELPRLNHNPAILPRPPAPPSVDRDGTAGQDGSCFSSLMDLQDSFSKSEAHRNFNSSIAGAAVNLRDNVFTGRKHNFYGVNCCYLHG